MVDLLKISIIAFVFVKLGEPHEIFAWYQRLISRLPDIVYRPLGGCLKCFTGQVCFWYFLVTNIRDYNLLNHLSFTAAGIFLSIIYNYLWQNFEK
jgi:hypothetical protein